MIFHPGIIGLMLSSLGIVFIAIYCSFYAWQTVRHWDIRSGSERQLILERRTYLISLFLSCIFVFQILLYFLFIFTVDRLHILITGAMCAAGALNANSFGYPALILKTLVIFLAGIWLILNHVDNRAVDYPLVRIKYKLLLAVMPVLVIEAVLQAAYFINLRPDIITSCCGTLLSSETSAPASGLWRSSSPYMKSFFFGSSAATIAAGVYCYRKESGGWFFGWISAFNLAVSLTSILTFISVYIYEMPTHHCPFCFLQKGYGYIGYPLYTALFGGSILGLGVASLMPFRKIQSLSGIITAARKRMSLHAAVLILVFVMIVLGEIAFSDFISDG